MLAYAAPPSYGFYNRGLALARSSVGEDLLGAWSFRFGRIAFKIKSRYLEHTLSRETVLKDANYDKALALLLAAADGPLRETLLARLEALAALPVWGLAELSEWGRLAWHLILDDPEVLLQARERPLLRTVGGRAVSLAAVEAALQRDGRVLLSDAATGLTERLDALGVPVLLGERPTRTLRDLRLLGEDARATSEALAPAFELVVRNLRAADEGSVSGQVRRVVGEAGLGEAAYWARLAAGWLSGTFASRALTSLGEWLETDAHTRAERRLARPEDVYLPVVPDEEPEPSAAGLAAAAAALLDRIGAGYPLVALGRLAVPDADAPLFVVGRRVGSLMARPPDHVDPERRPEALVNRDHPHFRGLLRLAEGRPELAAYCLAKGLLLTEDRLLDKDLALASAAGAF